MTKLIYLEDTYLFESEAEVKEIKNTEKGLAIILDQTIFYPQGGGQPTDHGKITTENVVFNVADVRLDEDGVVYHFGNFQNGTIKPGEKVTLKVDKERRINNAKLHSAGHLIAEAVKKLEIPGIKPVKGFHFPEGPYVEYEGTLENPQEYIPEIEKTVNELVEEDIKVEKEELSTEEAEKKGVWAPTGKSARIVYFQGYEQRGCGGTHVKASGEIGKIEIRKISSKKGMTKISYIVE
ncbi:hypothetical protein COU74_02530 [Candidatus Peregrinibacteria bacterium CG10_big_fil_rev_8_21_14_0_10_36_19]|nr:MAG: hypothetical protein COU74_02530 [Candidatus Peregrinibacteria bacterium CG10_big_fil_rev_8_21_14_0_10_36_19]